VEGEFSEVRLYEVLISSAKGSLRSSLLDSLTSAPLAVVVDALM
jgi:hypothetical protein